MQASLDHEESILLDIDNDHHEKKATSKNKKWIETQMYTLYDTEEAILSTPSKWLTDTIIDAAQSLLKSQCNISGLQHVCIGHTLAFDIHRTDFMQILHDGSSHWLLVTNIGGKANEAFVYDSLYSSISMSTKLQIASILASQANQISVVMVNCQRQMGSSDCGLFAVAFATALAQGLKPENFTFIQGDMRKHLYNCLSSGKLSMFPTKPRKCLYKVRRVETIPIYCRCRLPEIQPMIECSKCYQWCHTDCFNVPEAAINDLYVPWYCDACMCIS